MSFRGRAVDPGGELRAVVQRIEQLEREGLWRLPWGRIGEGGSPLEFVAVEGRRYRVVVAGAVGPGSIEAPVTVDGSPAGVWVDEQLDGVAQRFGWVVWSPAEGHGVGPVVVTAVGAERVEVLDEGGAL